MSELKHTPGPWYVTTGVHSETTDCYDKGETWFNVNGEDGVIADVLHGRCLSADEDEANANAHLIAAAPELLYACEMALQIIREIPDDYEYEDGENPVTILKNAIAKATNQPSKELTKDTK